MFTRQGRPFLVGETRRGDTIGDDVSASGSPTGNPSPPTRTTEGSGFLRSPPLALHPLCGVRVGFDSLCNLSGGSPPLCDDDSPDW